MASTIGSLFALSISALLLSTACSRQATCALEGCTKNGKVILATDGQGEEKASQDADAVVDSNSALEKEISSIKERMDLNESLTKTLAETISLHEKRIAALENKSTAADSALQDLNGRLTMTENGLWDTNDRVSALELLLDGSDDEPGLVQELADLRMRQGQMAEKIAHLKSRIRRLEDFKSRQEQWNRIVAISILKLTGAVKDLKERMKDAEENIGLLQEAVDGINFMLEGINEKLTNLQTQVDTMESTMATTGDLDDAKADVLETVRSEIEQAQDSLTEDIDAVRTLAASKTKCQISDKYREGLLWYRNITCDGRTLKILVL